MRPTQEVEIVKPEEKNLYSEREIQDANCGKTTKTKMKPQEKRVYRQSVKRCVICDEPFEYSLRHENQITCGKWECKEERARQIARDYKEKKKQLDYKKKTYAWRGKSENQEPQIKRNKYYCKRCEKEFWSKLPPGESICVFCGSSKVLTLSLDAL